MSRTKRRMTREEKVEENFRPAPPIQPLNPTQAKYKEAIYSSPIIFATGHAGTSKTYMPTRLASLWLKQNQINKIILIRPAVSMSESIGFAKGTHEEKMKHWLRPILDALREEFPPGTLNYLMKEEVGALDFCPLENAKGNSWSNAFIIVDEAEDCTLKEIKTLLTRVGKNSTMCLCGDISQVDLASSGMGEFLDLRKISARFQRVVRHISFTNYDEIVRSDICREIVMGFDELEVV